MSTPLVRLMIQKRIFPFDQPRSPSRHPDPLGMQIEFTDLTSENLKAKLDHYGYAIIKNVLPAERVRSYLERVRDAYKNIADASKPDKPLGYDIFDQSTFAKNTDDLIPYGGVGQLQVTGVGSLKLMDDLRAEENLRMIWAMHHNVQRKDLVPSRDGVSIFRPNHPTKARWLHIDADPLQQERVLRENVLQGVFVLSAPYVDQGFVVCPGSHEKLDQLPFEEKSKKSKAPAKSASYGGDWYSIPDKALEACGVQEPVTECGDPGDCIVFLSHTWHCNTGGDPKQHPAVGRVACYISYTPMAAMDAVQRAALETAVKEQKTTNHNLIRVTVKPENVLYSSRRWVCAKEDLADYSQTGAPASIIPWSS
jgi:ectoine hydroxylase-related dioxygenase (phytanoyl-CoA dioxygenase family)